MNETLENEKIVKGDYFIWKGSSIDRVSDKAMKVLRSFGFDMRRFSVSDGKRWSLSRHDFIPKGDTKPMRRCLNMSFLPKSKKCVKLLMSHETISTSQFESHREVRIVIVIVNGTKSVGWKKFNYERRVRWKSIKSKLKKATT